MNVEMVSEFNDFCIEEVEDVEALSESSMYYVLGAEVFILVGICAC